MIVVVKVPRTAPSCGLLLRVMIVRTRAIDQQQGGNADRGRQPHDKKQTERANRERHQ